MEVDNTMCAFDMRIILTVMDALDEAIDDGENVGLRFAGNIEVFEDDEIKGVIQLTEHLPIYVPASSRCGDCVPAVTTESDGAK